MATENRVIQKMLKDAGYEIIRWGKHPVYSNGTSQLILPAGSITSQRFRHWIRSQLRQRKRKEEAHAIQVRSPAP